MENFFKVSFLWILLTLCLYITLPAHAENACGISIPTEAGNLSCEGSTITWDDAGSADTIDRNSSCTVAITDALAKGKPYFWSVSGTGYTLDNTLTWGLNNTLRANDTACGRAAISVRGMCGGSSTTGYVNSSNGGGTIAWSVTGSASTIDRNSSCAVAITDSLGNGGPYTWSVSGTGFSLAITEPTGTSNTLYANGTACGDARIIVTGCGGSVAGFVKCTAGMWVLQPNTTPWPYGPSASGTIVGDKKLTGSLFVARVAGASAYTLAACKTKYDAQFNLYNNYCVNSNYPYSCTQEAIKSPYPNQYVTQGAWPKYYEPCWKAGNYYIGQIVWLGQAAQVWYWVCD